MAANGGLTVPRRRTQIPKNIQLIEANGALGKIRTPDPQIRSLVLYPEYIENA